MTMRIISTYIILLILTPCVFIGCTKKVPPEPANYNKSHIDLAIQRGKALYEAYTAEPTNKDALFIQKAKDIIKNFCDLNYRGLIVIQDNKKVVYFIGEPPAENDVVFGRHFKVRENVVTQSTLSCFVLPTHPKSVAVYSSHLLSRTPTEYHVFLSLLLEKPIYVFNTSNEIWRIVRDKIVFIGTKDQKKK